jgi:hypothetical protein
MDEDAKRIHREWEETTKIEWMINYPRESRRLDTYLPRIAMTIALDKRHDQIDEETMTTALGLVRWQLHARVSVRPLEGETIIAKKEERLRRKLWEIPLWTKRALDRATGMSEGISAKERISSYNALKAEGVLRTHTDVFEWEENGEKWHVKIRKNQELVSRNGVEFSGRKVREWLEKTGMKRVIVHKGSA